MRFEDSTKRICEFCQYAVFVKKTIFGQKIIECRRYPPQLVMVGQGAMGFSSYEWKPSWPQLPSDSFCGEFVISYNHSDDVDIYSREPEDNFENQSQDYRGVRIQHMRISGKYMVDKKVFEDKSSAMRYIDGIVKNV